MPSTNKMDTTIVEALWAAGFECETVGGLFIGLRFDGVRRCPNHGHLFDSLELVLEGDRVVIQPYYDGAAIGPDRVLESGNNTLVGEVVSFVKGLNKQPATHPL